jgi:hypothetical protein
MFRNGISRSQTQTQTQTSSNTGQINQSRTNTNQTTYLTGKYNTCGNSDSSNSNTNSNSDDEIIFAIVTGNISSVKRLINSSNVNNIIDKKNGFTALHHAVRIKKNDLIVEYLLSCGANISLKQDENKDSIDLAIESNYRYLIDKLMKDKEIELDNLYTKYDDINYKYKDIEKKSSEIQKTNVELEKTNDYLLKSNEQYANKIEELKSENIVLKRKLDDSETAFSNLLKKNKKN